MKKRITFTLDEKLIDELKATSDDTMIPQSRLVNEAIKELIQLKQLQNSLKTSNEIIKKNQP